MVAMSPSRVPRPTSSATQEETAAALAPIQIYFWDGNAAPAEATRRISHSSSSASLPADDDVRNVVAQRERPLRDLLHCRYRPRRRRIRRDGRERLHLGPRCTSSRRESPRLARCRGRFGSGKQGLVGAADQQRRSLPRVPQPRRRIWSQEPKPTGTSTFTSGIARPLPRSRFDWCLTRH